LLSKVLQPSIDSAVRVNQGKKRGREKANSLDRSNGLPYYSLFVIFRVLKRLHWRPFYVQIMSGILICVSEFLLCKTAHCVQKLEQSRTKF